MERQIETELISLSFIWDKYERLLLIKKGEKWGLPGGHKEHNELFAAAANRENIEEINLPTIGGSEALFSIEELNEGHFRMFLFYERYTLGGEIKKSSLISKKNRLEEGIKRVQWFPKDKLKKLMERSEKKLSSVAAAAIKKRLSLSGEGTSLSLRSANNLQRLQFDTERNITDKKSFKLIEKKISEIAELIAKAPIIKEKNGENKLPAAATKNRWVVIVEDDQMVCDLIREVLKDFFITLAFRGPTDAMAWLQKESSEKIKVILVDYHFKTEDKNGADFIQEVKELFPNIQTVLMTGEIEIIANYTGKLLPKPFGIEELQKIIANT